VSPGRRDLDLLPHEWQVLTDIDGRTRTWRAIADSVGRERIRIAEDSGTGIGDHGASSGLPHARREPTAELRGDRGRAPRSAAPRRARRPPTGRTRQTEVGRVGRALPGGPAHASLHLDQRRFAADVAHSDDLRRGSAAGWEASFGARTRGPRRWSRASRLRSGRCGSGLQRSQRGNPCWERTFAGWSGRPSGARFRSRTRVLTGSAEAPCAGRGKPEVRRFEGRAGVGSSGPIRANVGGTRSWLARDFFAVETAAIFARGASPSTKWEAVLKSARGQLTWRD